MACSCSTRMKGHQSIKNKLSRKNNYDEDVQSLKELQKWAKGMGAPCKVLQDLCKLEENKENLQKAFSGQLGEMLRHIVKHVKTLHEAENIKKTVLLYKLNTATKTVTSADSNVQGKHSKSVANYLQLKEKQEKIKALKEKCRCEEKKMKCYKTMVDVKISEYKQISQDTHDMLKMSVILELKNKSYKKQIDEWNEKKNILRKLNMWCTELEQADAKEAQKKVKNDVYSIISKMLETTQLCGNSQEEIASSFDQFIKDISELRFSTSPKVIIAVLTKIVNSCCKVIIKMNKTNLNIGNFSECRKGIYKYLTDLYQLEAQKTEETKKIKSIVENKEEVKKTLERELKELFYKHYALNVSINNNNETLKVRNDINDYLNLRVEKRRLSERNDFIRGIIDKLTHEMNMRKSGNLESLVNKFRFMHMLQNYLRTQNRRVKYCMYDKYKTCIEFCKQSCDYNYIGLKGVDFESIRNMMLEEVELIVQTPNPVLKRSWGKKIECLQSKIKQKLNGIPEKFQGADHRIIRNILEILITRKKVTMFHYAKDLFVPTMPFNTCIHIDKTRQRNDKAESVLRQQLQCMSQKVSEIQKLIEDVELIIETWSAQHFNNWIPESLELNGKSYLNCKDAE